MPDPKIHDVATDGPLHGGRWIHVGPGQFVAWPEGEPEPKIPKAKSKSKTKEAAAG